ncbi:hypothetical protein U1Q18_030823 [Sarracenia purpurea var. burkii]
MGTFTYFPSTLMHRAAGDFGGLNIASRPLIPVPYATPAEEFTILVSDWWKSDHKNKKSKKSEKYPHIQIGDGFELLLISRTKILLRRTRSIAEPDPRTVDPPRTTEAKIGGGRRIFDLQIYRSSSSDLRLR